MEAEGLENHLFCLYHISDSLLYIFIIPAIFFIFQPKIQQRIFHTKIGLPLFPLNLTSFFFRMTTLFIFVSSQFSHPAYFAESVTKLYVVSQLTLYQEKVIRF
jgi:hypothetical protein